VEITRLNDESGSDTVKRGFVVSAERCQLQKMPDMVWCLSGKHLNHNVAFRGRHHHAKLRKFFNRFLSKRRRGGSRTRPDGDISDFDAILCDLFVIDRRGGNLINDFDAFDDVAEGCELPGELGLIGYDNQKFGTGTVGFAGKQRGRDCSLIEWKTIELGLQTAVESASPVFRTPLRIFRFWITTLNDAVRHH